MGPKGPKIGNEIFFFGKTKIAHETANMEGDHETHGMPLPFEEIDETKKKLGLPSETFYLPDGVLDYFQTRFATLIEARKEWNDKLNIALSNPSFKIFWNTTLNHQFH